MSATFTLAEMIIVLNDEADYIQQCEDAAVVTGYRPAPEPGRVHKMEVMRAIARFLLRIEPKLDAVKTLLKEPAREDR